jgi:hypothetical protein
MNTPIASIPFIDGVTCAVYVDDDGRRYVLDDDGKPVCGAWAYLDGREVPTRAISAR